MTRSNELRARVLRREAITETQRDAMWRCFETIYAEITRSGFEADLDDKDTVIVLEDETRGDIQGFSTLCVEHHEHPLDGAPFVVVYSGDTVILPKYWGDTALQGAFYGCLMRVIQDNIGVPVYWFLISKGYKTYLLLARNFPNYWPHRDRTTPPREAAIIDHLSRQRFGDAWDASRGTLHFETSHGRLIADVAPVDGHTAEDPDIRFFVTRNPGHAEGEELCCLGAVDVALATSYWNKLARRRGA